MKATRITIATAVGAALIALASIASAQGGAASGPAYGPGYGPGPYAGRMGPGGAAALPERAAARMKALEAELKLQPDQKPAFDAFAAKVRSEAEVHAKFREGMRAHIGDPQAMLEQRATIAKHNAEAFEQLSQLRKNLVAALTPEQKLVLDRYAAGFGYGPHAGGRAWGGPRGGGWGPGCAMRGA